MKNHIIFSFPGNTQLTVALANKLEIEIGSVEFRYFPDEESYIRINSDVQNKVVIIVCGLEHPNNKILSLMFISQTMKELGASKICLISPYLPYMRQDKRFNPGEAITAILFAKYLSGWIDYLITIDPHLHRITNLSDIYSAASTSVLHAAPKIAEWVNNNVDSPLIIGPDEESLQWVTTVADITNAPYAIVKKHRYEDRKVEISVPEINERSRTPVLIDDIISTGSSMSAVIQALISNGFKNPVCVGIHALFNDETYNNLLLAGAEKIVTCNTISHTSNKIDITDIIVEEIKRLQLCQNKK